MADQRSIEDTLERCLKLLNTNTAHPEMFLSVQDGLASEFTSLTKTLYDVHKAHEPVETKGSPLEQLVIENFDEEQIWQELELQNLPILRHFELTVKKATSNMEIMIIEEDEDNSEDEVAEDNISDVEEELSEEEEGEEDDEQVEEQRPKANKSSSRVVEKFSDEDSDLDFDVDALEKQAKQRQQIKRNTRRETGFGSEVDDRFFKLSEMEAFLEDVEKKEMDGDDGDSEIDYFQDIPSGEEDELDLEEGVMAKRKKQKKSSRNLKYKDFFDPIEEGLTKASPAEDDGLEFEDDEEGETTMQEEEDDDDQEEFYEEEDMSENEESREAREPLKKVTFDLPDESEGEEMEEIFGGKKRKAEEEEGKSPFEKRQAKMAEKIQELEKAALQEKPWQLTGEATGQLRPENSLLQEDLEFDQTARVAPAITEETTLKLEDIIKQRIKDQVWDDVVRKEKPKEDVFEYKKRLTLDHEKSKQSLAEVYEQEYLKQAKKVEEEENPAHVEIQKLMDTLLLKLDALSNFHFTPKPPVPEVKVVSNLPSITMEEVAPVSASSTTLLAPEEIKEKNKAGNLLGDSEKSGTDKKRERRKKRRMKRIRLQEKEKKRKLREASKSGENKKQTKAEVAESLKKLAKGGGATLVKDDGKDKALRSSQAFFSQLQDQVKTQIKGAKDQASKKKKQKQISASKLKL
ncbi:U3 small nucleolar ribonucleoprotein protein MPP10 isoform X2 [Brienomyrus brachyistius]|uniref:U3 small nucleolar ribonucleoprotein protein MPP10 isoform X2 n=1 Tax=Brienomyrus brachyistius TaxID=42636 RepID=UPI0020B18E28|nr:U3 small nucleolar ribonucleoprotein protein MPP10 isoform X2 [Brienomyrus brachyistius]